MSRSRQKSRPASFAPPATVQRAAGRALQVRRELPPSRRGMTSVGLARARDLASGRRVSWATIRRMRAYFARHAVDKLAANWEVGSRGWVAWHAWGGDAGERWVASIVRRYG